MLVEIFSTLIEGAMCALAVFAGTKAGTWLAKSLGAV